MLFGGVTGVVVSTVMFCKAATKAEKIGAETLAKRKIVEDVKNNESIENYSEKDYQKDIIIVWKDHVVGLITVYGPAVTLSLLSLGLILGSHGLMKKRHLALLAAYKGLEQTIAEHQQKEAGGGKVVESAEGTASEEDALTGDEVPTTRMKYTAIFDNTCLNWSEVPEYNLTFLKAQQSFANEMLHARDHVILHEVLDQLGIERTPNSLICGWVDNADRSAFIDFGIFDPDGDGYTPLDDLLEYRQPIELSFNVQGVMYDLVGPKKKAKKTRL